MLFDDWTDLDAVVSFDVIDGASASTAAGSVSARGTASAAATGASGTATGQLTAAGAAKAAAIGTQVTATAGDATAFGTVDIPGTASVVGAGATSAAGEVTAAANGQASVTGNQASTSTGGVSAIGDEVDPEQPPTPAGRPIRPQAYTPPFVRVDAVAKVKPAAMRTHLGVVQADGTISVVAGVGTAGASALAGKTAARGILNPTDDELMLLLLAA
jgi:hypothetical protein